MMSIDARPSAKSPDGRVVVTNDAGEGVVPPYTYIIGPLVASDRRFMNVPRFRREQLQTAPDDHNVATILWTTDRSRGTRHVVSLVESLSHCVHLSHVLQQLVENAKSSIGDVTHCVLQYTGDCIQNQIEW